MALGAPVVHATPVLERGYTNNRRWLVRLDGGGSAFVKAAADERTAGWLRREHRVYQHLPSGLGPRLLGWVEGSLPLLVLEDLSAARWPPPWDAAAVDRVLNLAAEVAATPAPPGLPALEESDAASGTWSDVAADPQPFLSIGLCTPSWFEIALPRLLDAARPELLHGDDLLHLDVRSDNLCLRDGRALLVDWNLAAVGNATFDVAFWLPSLHAEGGPAPELVADLDPGLAALVAGFFAARAGLPVIPQAPRVREVQRVQLAAALPWAARVLGLPPPLP